MEYRDIKTLKELPNNPRLIKDKQFEKLCKSIKDNKQFFEARPCILSNRTGELIIIAGNQRFKAAKHLKFKQVPTFLIEGLNEEQEREIIIRDNVSNGEFDWNLIANEWNTDELIEWGLELPVWGDVEDSESKTDNNYSRKIEIPTYEPKNEKPPVYELFDIEKTNKLIDEIENSSCDKEIKTFLTIAAQRHIVFNYSKIADFYSHSDIETQNLMENSALVIIDFNKAIELGFVMLSEQIAEQYSQEYPNESE